MCSSKKFRYAGSSLNLIYIYIYIICNAVFLTGVELCVNISDVICPVYTYNIYKYVHIYMSRNIFVTRMHDFIMAYVYNVVYASHNRCESPAVNVI